MWEEKFKLAETPVADLGGAPGARPPPTDQNFFNFIGFFRKYD